MQVSIRLKKELDSLKIHPRETYNDVLERLLEDRRELNSETQLRVEKARQDVRAGKFKTHKQLLTELGH